jgi:RND family efflux transporter MFP subunit
MHKASVQFDSPARFFLPLSRFILAVRGIPLLLRNPARRWWLIAPIALLLTLAGGLTYYAGVQRAAQAASQETLQTTLARRGSIVLSAGGTGTLLAANQSDLTFKATGKLAKMYVKVGDKVEAGQLLAELDNVTQQLKLAQARANLGALTSVSAIGSAQQSMAGAAKNLQSAQLQLEYLISPEVYYWENEVAKYEKAVRVAQTAATAAPTDKAAQENLKKALAVLDFGQDKMKLAKKDYHDYAESTFGVETVDPVTKQSEYYLGTPSDADILKARQDVTIAEGALNDAKNLYRAVTGGRVAKDASGSGLIALEQARLDLKTAQDNLDATKIVAPYSGTIVSISAQLGPVSAVATPVGSTAATNPLRSTSIMAIADMSHLYVQTYVDESDYAKFKVGNAAEIVFDVLPDQTLTGKVTQVDPTLNTSSGSAVVSGLVELDPTSADLLLGMSASVNVIAAKAENVVVVPLAALHEYSPGQYAVFVMRDGQLKPQLVEVGLKDLVSAEIKSGLQPGDTVSTGLLATR